MSGFRAKQLYLQDTGIWPSGQVLQAACQAQGVRDAWATP